MDGHADNDWDLVVAGGGAAGVFAAVTCAAARPGARVLVLEKAREPLGKVRISGGGRCNVTHACFEPKALTAFYPRGARSLIGPFHRWGPEQTIEWFEGRGVPLKTEPDGRVFPVSDRSQSIIDALLGAARETGVVIRKQVALRNAEQDEAGGFRLELADGGALRTRHLLLTLGGTRNALGGELAAGFGHRVLAAAPSLFTFKIEDPRLEGLQGLAVPNARVAVEGMKHEATGPVLITHWGLSGPAVLRVSAWGARDLHGREYQFGLRVNWTGSLREEQVMAEFDRLRVEAARKLVVGDAQLGIPTRLWRRLAELVLGAGSEVRWAHLPRKAALPLASELAAGRFEVAGKSTNKDEFVTCGGVHLGDVNFKTMESRKVPGLFFAGEILDIDGITGGFNFQAAWTTGRIAGESVADLG